MDAGCVLVSSNLGGPAFVDEVSVLWLQEPFPWKAKTKELPVIEIQIPIENEAEVTSLEATMRQMGGKDVDVFSGLFDLAEAHLNELMGEFRHPSTGERVAHSFRRKVRMLILEVELEDAHEDTLAEHLGASREED